MVFLTIIHYHMNYLLFLLICVLSLFFFFFFGHGVQWFDMGSQFLDQGLNLGHSSERAESYPLGHQGTPMFLLI